MSDKLKEFLSAAMDDEADEFELRRLLDEASEDQSLHAVWQRYHLVRGVLQHGRYGSRAAPAASIDSLWRRIDAGEGLDEHVAAAVRSAPSWVGRIAGAAVAATVALAIVLGFNLAERQPPGSVDLLAGLAYSSPALQVDVPNAAVRPALDEFPSRIDMQRTRAYMLHHAQHTSMYHQAGIVPFVKVAAFQGR
jgi:sigma-E factor negative regulatory protein RseA